MQTFLQSWRSYAVDAFTRYGWMVGTALVLAPLLLFALGCSQPPLSKSEPPTVAKQADSVKSQAVDVINRSEQIDKHADEAAKVPGAEKPAEAIKAENKEIRNDAHAIAATAVEIRDVQKRIDGLVKERDAAIARAEKAESEAGRWESRTLAGIRIAAGLAVAVSITLLFWGTLRTALPTLIAATVFASTLAIQLAIEYRLLIGIVCGGLTVAAIVYELWIKKQSIRQIVTTVDDSLRSVNGQLPEKMVEIAGYVQSKTTAKLIDAAQGNGPINKFRRWLGGFIAGQRVEVKV